MSSNKPLQYENLKIVLQYMEANSRYQISSHIPSLRITEKLVPIRFDSLSFNSLQTRVNTTTYRLGIYREYPDASEVPIVHQKANEKGGSLVDLTEHGLEIYIARQPVSPGDIDIRVPEGLLPQEFHHEHVIDTNQTLYENKLRNLERVLERRLKHGDDAFLGTGNPILSFSAQKLRAEIQNFRAHLAPFYCRRDGTPLPYTLMIQLTVDSPGGKYIYRHPYTIKLHDALKKVNTTLFGKRNCVHQLRSLSINEERMVIRLPLGFRIRVRELEVTWKGSFNYNSLQSIIDKSSYPLNVLTICEHVFDMDTYDHEVVRSARELNISPNHDPRPTCLPILRTLNNQSVNLRCLFLGFTVRQQVQLVEHWINTGKAVGTTLLYQTVSIHAVTDLLNAIQTRFAGSLSNMLVFNRFIQTVRMRMNNGNFLEVQCYLMGNPLEVVSDQKCEVRMRLVAGQ